MPHPNLQLIVFDLDGTLADSHRDLTDALNYAMAQLGKPGLPYEAVPPLLGSGLGYLLQETAQTSDTKVLKAAKQHFDEYYAAHFTNKTQPYPGVSETLPLLSRYKLAVYSNKLHHFTLQIVGALGLAPHFSHIQGARPELYPYKPHPGGLMHILSQLGIAPENALMVGDSTHDIEAAKRAGMQSCAVTYGYRSEAALEAASPGHIIHNFPALTAIL